MPEPIAPGSRVSPSAPPYVDARETRSKNPREDFRKMFQNVNALSQPTTPEKRLPVVDKTQVDPQLVKAAEGMESLYLNYLMSVMRKTVPESDMSLNSPATKIYQGMLDSEYAQTAARTGGTGLSDLIIAYLTESGYNISQGKHSASPSGDMMSRHEQEKTASTGGTHEGQPTKQ